MQNGPHLDGRIQLMNVINPCAHHSAQVTMKDSRLAPSQWETALLCNDVSHWLGANLESALRISISSPVIVREEFHESWDDTSFNDVIDGRVTFSRQQFSCCLCALKLLALVVAMDTTDDVSHVHLAGLKISFYFISNQAHGLQIGIPDSCMQSWSLGPANPMEPFGWLNFAWGLIRHEPWVTRTRFVSCSQ